MSLSDANSTEFNVATPHPVIHIMEDQEDVRQKGGTMRLGSYPCRLIPGTRAADAYGPPGEIVERHRHRFEFNNAYKDRMDDAGLIISGLYDEKGLAEIMEIRDHPFMMGTQFHPEFRSRPTRPHPLFREFVSTAARILRAGEQAPMPLDDDQAQGDVNGAKPAPQPARRAGQVV